MPNYRRKGLEYMRELGRRGGIKSGKMRRLHSLMMDLANRQTYWEVTGRCLTAEQVRKDFEALNLSGGDHNSDWRCPQCGHFSSINRWVCGACHSLAPSEGRVTRAMLRARES